VAEIILYTTAGCHLCEQAEQLLRVVADLNQLSWHAVDIAEDAALVERFGVRIPVIQVAGAADDLGWPFDEAALISYLQNSL
tara:strand:- start:5151 stop:5396 length:246 start_codon:yes stop_codon:yes gene_type:complete